MRENVKAFSGNQTFNFNGKLVQIFVRLSKGKSIHLIVITTGQPIFKICGLIKKIEYSGYIQLQCTPIKAIN